MLFKIIFRIGKARLQYNISSMRHSLTILKIFLLTSRIVYILIEIEILNLFPSPIVLKLTSQILKIS